MLPPQVCQPQLLVFLPQVQEDGLSSRIWQESPSVAMAGSRTLPHREITLAAFGTLWCAGKTPGKAQIRLI